MFTSIFHKVLRFFHMNPTTKVECVDIPKDPMRINIYCQMLRSHFVEEGDARMNDYLVIEAKLYKSAAASRHEYISLKVQGPKKKIIYVAIERARGTVVDKVDKKDDPNAKDPYDNDDEDDDDQPAGGSAAQRSTNQPTVSLSHSADAAAPPTKSRKSFYSSSPSPSVASLDKFIRTRNAEDYISPLGSTGMHTNTDQVFRTLIFPGIPLYEVALLASTLHKMRRFYLLFSDNCYYYAGTIIKTLEEKYKPMLAVETTGSTDLDEKLELKKMKKNQAGKWYGIPVYDKEDVDTAPVIALFDKDLKIFRDSVDDAANKRKQQEMDNKARKEAEAKQREEAEARKAAEAKQREEAEARKAAEAKQREEAEARKAAEAKQREEAEARKAAETKQKTAETKQKAAETKQKAAEAEAVRVRKEADAEIARLKAKLGMQG